MSSKSKGPSAEADIDELQAWAARANKPATSDAQATPSAAVATPVRLFGLARTGRNRKTTEPGMRGGSLLPKIVLAIGLGLAAYLVFSFIIGLLIWLVMIAGGAALLYAVFRIGRWQGNRDD